MAEPESTGERESFPPNRLAREVSPYLLQHAYNPVDWYPWGDEAFEVARERDLPVFLSIGYSSCHWCHVMEKESFEDPGVAEVLNRGFVPVKVDREERPDLDQVYMVASQALSGSGGWPLNLVLTPDRKPFFAMTYVPRDPTPASPGLVQILSEIEQMWKGDRTRLISAADSILRRIEESLDKGTAPRRSALEAGYESLLLNFDRVYGGFGMAPKFPLAHNHLFLLRYSRLNDGNRDQAIRMVESTLTAMLQGGIYDHLGSGFHRYATDARWQVPHFEKMLPDQGLMVLALLEAFQATGNPEPGSAARDCLAFVGREMTSPEGAFFSSIDADTAGEEGAYYLWTRKEVADLLPEPVFRVAADAWHLTTAGNYLDPATGSRTGKNILYRTRTFRELARPGGMTPERFDELFSQARATLLSARERRERPLTDDKILTDWNGLMIAAYSRAARVFSENDYLDTAAGAADFILDRMRDREGTLLHRWRRGSAGIRGMAPDYAFLVFGLTELAMATSRPGYLAAAAGLQQELDARFWDERRGGYFTSAHDQEDVVSRQKEFYDGAIPAANSVAFFNLHRLSQLTGDPSYIRKATDLTRLYGPLLARSPAAHTFFLAGLSGVYGPFSEVVIAGGEDRRTAEDMAAALGRTYAPFTVVLKKNPEISEELGRVAPYTAAMTPVDGKTAAYVCSRQVCSRPVTTVEEMLSLVEKK